MTFDSIVIIFYGVQQEFKQAEYNERNNENLIMTQILRGYRVGVKNQSIYVEEQNTIKIEATIKIESIQDLEVIYKSQVHEIRTQGDV